MVIKVDPLRLKHKGRFQLQGVIRCCRVLQGVAECYRVVIKVDLMHFFVEQKGRFESIQRPCCHGSVSKFWVNKKVSVSLKAHRFISIVQLPDAVLINFAY